MSDLNFPLFRSTNYLTPPRIDVFFDALVLPAVAIALTVLDAVVTWTFPPALLLSAADVPSFRVPVYMLVAWRVGVYLLFAALFGSLYLVWRDALRSKSE